MININNTSSQVNTLGGRRIQKPISYEGADSHCCHNIGRLLNFNCSVGEIQKEGSLEECNVALTMLFTPSTTQCKNNIGPYFKQRLQQGFFKIKVDRIL